MTQDLDDIQKNIRQNIKNLIELARKIRTFQQKLAELEKAHEKKERPE